MWVAVELERNHSSWNELSTANTLDELKGLSLERSVQGKVYYFWNTQFPTDPAALQAIYDEMVEANNGAKLTVHVGAKVGPLEEAVTNGCSGNLCFCVVQPGYRHCQFCYQAPGGAVCEECSGSC